MYTEEIESNQNRFKRIVEEYEQNFLAHLKEVKSKVVYEQVGIGCKYLHRGYYCPSIIDDIIWGNASRGKIVKDKSNINDERYIYSFDKDERLILVQHLDDFEFIIHLDQTEIGVGISRDMKIQFISECRFSNKHLLSYIFCLYNPYEKCIIELTKEDYTYLDEEVQVYWSRYFKGNRSWIKQYEKYSFAVNDGYLSSYKIEIIDEKTGESNTLNDKVFKIRSKRIIN